jgi:hypothetical protein
MENGFNYYASQFNEICGLKSKELFSRKKQIQNNLDYNAERLMLY